MAATLVQLVIFQLLGDTVDNEPCGSIVLNANKPGRVDVAIHT